MIDLTPLDVRNKRGDFKRLMRGYDPHEVDVFLELVAERLEGLVRENIQLRERTQTLQQQVTSQLGREQAVQDALVTAQELRADIKAQSQREAEYVLKEAETEARRVIAEAEAQVRGKLRGVERQIDGAQDILVELERRRARFLKDFRALLDREMEVVGVEEGRTPLEDRTIDLDLGPHAGGRDAARSWSPERLHVDDGDDQRGARGADARNRSVGPAESDTEADGDAEGDEGVEHDETEARSPGAATAIAPDDASAVAADADVHTLAAGSPTAPSDLELPTFATPDEPSVEEDEGGDYDDLAVSMQAEAMAEAQSQVVEVTGDDARDVSEVPRLEEVLAEAGAELVEGTQERVSSRSRGAHKIEPPRIDDRGDPTLLLYTDKDEPEAR